MQRFIAEKNIQHFKALLERETDAAQRGVLLRMIEEEEAKLAGQSAADPPRPSAGPTQPDREPG